MVANKKSFAIIIIAIISIIFVFDQFVHDDCQR